MCIYCLTCIFKANHFMKLSQNCISFILMCTSTYKFFTKSFYFFCSELLFSKQSCKGALYWLSKSQIKKRKRYLNKENNPTHYSASTFTHLVWPFSAHIFPIFITANIFVNKITHQKIKTIPSSNSYWRKTAGSNLQRNVK